MHSCMRVPLEIVVQFFGDIVAALGNNLNFKILHNIQTLSVVNVLINNTPFA